jgi:putative DNA primase/helicase
LSVSFETPWRMQSHAASRCHRRGCVSPRVLSHARLGHNAFPSAIARTFAADRRRLNVSDRRGGSGVVGQAGQDPQAARHPGDRARRREGRLIVGRLQEHGRAHYQFRPQEALSYFVRVLTNQGERILWGKDLERALARSVTQPQIGALIGAQRIAREAVTVTERKRDAEGRVVSHSEHYAHRNRWRVEKVKFFSDRARLARKVRDEHVDVREAVRAHPELKSTFLTVRAAEEFAAQRIADPTDRERFLELVRGAIAGSIKKGEPLPVVRLRDGERSAPTKGATARAGGRDDGQTR